MIPLNGRHQCLSMIYDGSKTFTHTLCANPCPPGRVWCDQHRPPPDHGWSTPPLVRVQNTPLDPADVKHVVMHDIPSDVTFRGLGCVGYFESRWADGGWSCSLDTLHEQANAYQEVGKGRDLAAVRILDLSPQQVRQLLLRIQWNQGPNVSDRDTLRRACDYLLIEHIEGNEDYPKCCRVVRSRKDFLGTVLAHAPLHLFRKAIVWNRDTVLVALYNEHQPFLCTVFPPWLVRNPSRNTP